MKYLVVLAISSVAFGQSADGQPETVSLSETLTTECYSHLDRRTQLGPLRTDSTNPEVPFNAKQERGALLHSLVPTVLKAKQ